MLKKRCRDVMEALRKCFINVREVLRKCYGRVTEVSWKSVMLWWCEGEVSES